MAAKPSRPKGARVGRVVFGSVGLAGSAAIVMALGPVWTPMPVSADVLATPMRAVENAELAAEDAGAEDSDIIESGGLHGLSVDFICGFL